MIKCIRRTVFSFQSDSGALEIDCGVKRKRTCVASDIIHLGGHILYGGHHLPGGIAFDFDAANE